MNAHHSKWMSKFFTECASINDAKRLRPYTAELYKLVDWSNYRILNEFLSLVDPKQLSTLSIVFVLRYTQVHRDDLPSWHDVLAAAVVELDSRGANTKSLLAGLL